MVASCSSGKGHGAAPTTAPTSTTVPVTAPPLPTLHFGSPAEAIRHLYLQWEAGDRDAAGQAATPDAVNELFSKPPWKNENRFRGCSDPKDTSLGSDCTYQYFNGLLELHVSFNNGNWIVTQVQFEGV